MGLDHQLMNHLLTQAYQYYQSYNSHDLERMLVIEWSKAEGTLPPVRATDNRGIRIVNRLKRSVAEHSEVVSITSGMIVSDIVSQLLASGIDIARYEVPIAIMIALVVQSVLKDWRGDSG